jgi:hypothetical protein
LKFPVTLLDAVRSLRGLRIITELRGDGHGLQSETLDSVQQTTAKSVPIHGKGWRRWLVACEVLCFLVALGAPSSADDVCPDSQSSVSPPFDFHAFTKHRPFELNTCMTTPYGPAWADILLKPENFLECKGAPIALCYYSGPGPVTPCEFAPGETLASCTCYEIPSGYT